MPQFIVMFVIVATMLLEWTGESGLLPSIVRFAPELGGGLALLYVIIEGRTTRLRYVRSVYWIVFCGFVLHLLAGLFANHVEPGPIITGLRYFFRSIPLFLLPAVYAFSEKQIKQQLTLIVALSLLQVPVTLYQLLFTDSTGDGIYGTMLQTSFLSPFLIAVACLLTAFRIAGRITVMRYMILLGLVVLPTTINETKITMFLLPVGLTVVWALGSPPGKRMKNTAIAVGLSGVLLTGFVTIYATLQSGYEREGRDGVVDIFKFFSSDQVGGYLKSNAGIGAGEYEVGRVDAFTVPFRFVARDPVKFWFGVGMGNASMSPLGTSFQGRYAELFRNFMSFTAVTLVLETGLGGLLTAMLLVFLIFLDARVVAGSEPSIEKAIAVGWLGVSALMAMLIFYSDTIVSSPIAFLYWYFSGLVAARRMRLALAKEDAAVARTVGAD
ncbi:MAG: hypothetical protein ABIT36_12830 [Steroidobacteraceae bacterium]